MPSYRNREDTDTTSQFQNIDEGFALLPADYSIQGAYETIYHWQKDVPTDTVSIGSPADFERYIEYPEQATQSDCSEDTQTVQGSAPSLESTSTAASPILDEPGMARQLMPRQEGASDAQEMYLPAAGFASTPANNMQFQFGPQMEHHHAGCPRFALQYSYQHDPSCPAHNNPFSQLHPHTSSFQPGLSSHFHFGAQQGVAMPQYPIMQGPTSFYGPLNSQLAAPASQIGDAVQPLHTFARVPTPSSSSVTQEPLASGDVRLDNEPIIRTVSPAAKSEVSTSLRANSGRASPRSSDASQGRKSHLYNAQPREDGMYHCHFEGDESCMHGPTNLKCNYDKYIDSHLKPYRCSRKGCEELHFSSTACRLRHEREAHGSHGHGKKPFPCKFPDCDRHENGFPRHWNCIDHMKRVHGYDPEAKDEEAPAVNDDGKALSTTSSSNTARTSKKRSRKDSAGPSTAKRSKTMTESKTKAGASTLEDVEEHAQLHTQWRALRNQLQDCVSQLGGPKDKTTLQQLKLQVQRLTEINEILST